MAFEDVFPAPRVDLVVLSEAPPFLALAAVSGELLVARDPVREANYQLAKGFGQPAAEYRDIPRYLAEVSRGEPYDICATKLGDVESAVLAVRAWIAAHPELVDASL